jgi:hypothetical protein
MRSRGARRAVAGAVVALAAGATAVACVLADPPADLPVSPIQAPQIIRDEVQPPILLLDTLPNEIYAPVTVDPREADLGWRWAVDGVYLPATQSEKIASRTTVPVAFLPQTPVAEQCHTLELDVFYVASTLPGDTVTWFYSPSRSFAGCPVYDAGTPDAGVDAAAETGSGSDD